MGTISSICVVVVVMFSTAVAFADDASEQNLAALVELETVKQLATGFQFTEGPLWDPDGFLIFSDIPANKIMKWTPPDKVDTFRDPSGNSNGMTFDLQGRLIVCEHGNRRVSRTDRDGNVTTVADRYQGKRLNSPNDVVVRSDGSIYFTDPPYGVEDDERELDFQGVYRIALDGTLSLLADDFDRPNGLAFSPDEKVLYIADSSQRRHLRAFDVEPDGSLKNGRVFVAMSGPGRGGPDGMKVDQEGNVFSPGPGGMWVIDKTGTHLGTIPVKEVPANCAFGETDLKTLYMTARRSLYSVRVKVPGVRSNK
jgi:gluconolactonase